MKVSSIFSQILKLFSRGAFEQAVKQHKAERHARGFTSWASSWPCCFARWEGRIPCARFVGDLRVAKGN
jgi:hypothetical protein